MYKPIMKIQINEYNTEAFEFAKVYLKYYEPEWFGTPGHMLVSPEFWKTLNDGVLDFMRTSIRVVSK